MRLFILNNVKKKKKCLQWNEKFHFPVPAVEALTPSVSASGWFPHPGWQSQCNICREDRRNTGAKCQLGWHHCRTGEQSLPLEHLSSVYQCRRSACCFKNKKNQWRLEIGFNFKWFSLQFLYCYWYNVKTKMSWMLAHQKSALHMNISF